jgi:hypothetical protein
MLEDLTWKMEKELPNIMYRKFLKEAEAKMKNKLKGKIHSYIPQKLTQRGVRRFAYRTHYKLDHPLQTILLQNHRGLKQVSSK